MNIPDTGELVSESSAKRRAILDRFDDRSSEQRDASRLRSRTGITELFVDVSTGDVTYHFIHLHFHTRNF